MKFLIIEDDMSITDTVSLVLKLAWPDSKIVSSTYGTNGITLAETQNPDAILLDLGLPDIDGYEVLKQIRAFSTVPIIIITVKTDENALVKAFSLDANDYIEKPFRQMELLARLKAALKRHSFLEEDLSVSAGGIGFGSSIQEIKIDDQTLLLTSTEGRLLYHLVKNAGRVISTHELAEMLWGEYIPGATDNIKNYVSRLRKKIEKDFEKPLIIQNRRGLGYIIPIKS
ncbi:response regulator transcription factor [Dehalogenimonas sp. THU2]|uniref:response regulator transcription factor n=1 Tax=Dehalogenimonas sp. THU2 TaxID=3151121 RepID=UPI0032182CD7